MMRNLLHKRNVWALAILMVIAALGIAQAATTRPQTASLSGQVVTAVSVGASVQEGSVLVTVKSQLQRQGRFRIGKARKYGFSWPSCCPD